MKYLNWLQSYRIDVYVFFAALTFSLWQYLPSQKTGGIDDRLTVGFCFMCGLVWIYLYNKTTDRVEDAVSQPQEMMSESSHQWAKRLLPLLIVIPATILYVIDMPVLPYLIYIGIGCLYSYPVYKHYRVKNIFFLKNFWAYIDMFLPIWFGVYIYFPNENTVLFAGALVSFAFFYLAGEVLWDIRDVAGDRVSKVNTIPVVLGVPVAKIIGLVFVAIGLAMSYDYHVANYAVAGVLAGYLYFLQPASARIHFHLMLYVLSGIIFLGAWF